MIVEVSTHGRLNQKAKLFAHDLAKAVGKIVGGAKF